MPYTHCKTRIVSLLDFDIPDKATEAEYRELYRNISQSRSSTAQSLVDAVSSISLGIAPPVAFPTETVYGLGADATNHASIAGIFAAKGRPSDNPLIVHVASREHLERLTGNPVPEVYRDLIKDHWPGPLTILIPLPSDKSSVFAPNVHPGQRTIGFRVPESKFARFFIAATGKPIAAPSANSSGKPSPTTSQHVLDDLNGRINFVLDGGPCDVGVESTVVDGLHHPPLILRPGGLSQDDLVTHGRRHGNVWKDVQIGYKQKHEGSPDPSKSDTTNAAGSAIVVETASISNQPGTNEEAPRAPGMKYKHYAPKGKMTLFEGENSHARMQEALDAISVQQHATMPSQSPSDTPNGAKPVTEQNSDSGSNPVTINIAILTTTSWSVSTLTDSSLAHNVNNDTNKINQITNGVSSTPLSPITKPSTTRIKLHIIPLGKTPIEIARSLFATLRTCDDLNCTYILAEAPTPTPTPTVKTHDDHITSPEDADSNIDTGVGVTVKEEFQFDAVLERMRKAASHVVVS